MRDCDTLRDRSETASTDGGSPNCHPNRIRPIRKGNAMLTVDTKKIAAGYRSFTTPDDVAEEVKDGIETGNVGTSISLSVTYSASLSWTFSWSF